MFANQISLEMWETDKLKTTIKVFLIKLIIQAVLQAV